MPDHHSLTASLAPALARAGLAMLLGSPLTMAQANEGLFFGEVPLILTASRLTQTPYDAPAPVTVIDREMIEASGFTELHDLLRLVPGFLVADWAGGSPTVANHGLGDAYGRRIKVLIDGRTVNNPLRGHVDWQDLPLRVEDIERVEVLRSPGGAAFGANAFQGVIQFITRSPSTESGHAVIVRGGNNGFQDAGLRINGKTDAGLDWRGTVSQRRADGFHPYDDGAMKTIERTTANVQGTLQAGNIDQFRFFAGGTTGYNRTGIPSDPASPTRHAQTREHHLQLVWQRSFSPDSELLLQFAHLDHSSDDNFTVSIPGFTLPIRRDTRMRRDELDVQVNHRFSPEWQALIGAAVVRDAVRSRYYLDEDGSLGGTHWQTFGTVTWTPTPKLSLNLGATFEDHYNAGRLFSPRVAANYKFSPFSVVRLSGGTAFRAPTIQEADSFQVVRQNGQIIDIGVWSREPLEAERVRFVELGYVGSLPSLGLSLDARVFHEDYDHYIDEQRCRYTGNPSRRCAWPQPPWLRQNTILGPADTVFLVNAGAVRMDGVDLRLDWRRPGWGRVVLNQSFIDVDELKANTDPDMDLTAPRTQTSILLIKELPDRWSFSLGFYHADRMYWLNDGDVVPSNGRTDLRLAKRFGPADRDNEIAITMQSVEGDYTDFHEGNYKHQSLVFATLKLSW
jgi:iron complex outermembrane receptor protein